MKSQTIDVVTAGHICVDISPRFEGHTSGRQLEKIFRPGALTVVGPAVLSSGGGVANVGLSALRMGLNVALMGKCGKDLLGEALLSLLRSASPECARGMRVTAGETTSYSVVLAPPGTDRFFLHCPGANDTFVADDIDLEMVSRARLFYFGYPPLMARMYQAKGEELARVLAGVKGRGVTTALDMALPDPAGAGGQADWPAILAGALPHVDLFVPSVEEVTFMLRRDEYDRLVGRGDILDALTPPLLRELSERCLKLGPAVVMIKCGRHGLYLRSAPRKRIEAMGSAAPKDPAAWAGRELFAPSYQVPRVISALGAGDSAVAGLLCGLLHGADVKTAADYACAAGAQNVQVIDATSGIRHWDVTTRELSHPRVQPVVTLD